MNKFHCSGRLCQDPEVKYSKDKPIANFNIAVERQFKREGEATADFFKVTCFDKKAEFAEKYLSKGTKIILTGRLENNDYTNRDGVKVYQIRIVAEEIEFAESKKSADSNESGQNNETKQANESQEGFMNIPDGADEELPFN